MNQVQKLLGEKRFEKYHFNAFEDVDWVSSTGSLEMDIYLGGGIRPGIFRISGPFEGGKTMFSLTCGKIFQETVKNSFVVYINAEGRITPDKFAMSGIDLSPEKFQRVDCNVSDVVYDMIRDLILNNEKKVRYMFILDSVDSLQRLSDFDKPFEESEKVAGGALINSVMGKKMTLPLTKFGHQMFVLSQERVDLSTTSSYTGPKKTSSGGKALGHYSSVYCEIAPKYVKDYIWEKEKTADGDKDRGKPLGHYATFKFVKTRNDRSMESVVIPIRRGRTGGNSIWREYEVYSLGSQWKLLNVKGSWIEINPAIVEELKKVGYTGLTTMQGEKKFIKHLEDNKILTDFLWKKFETLIANLSREESFDAPVEKSQKPQKSTKEIVKEIIGDAVPAITGEASVPKKRGRPKKAK